MEGKTGISKTIASKELVRRFWDNQPCKTNWSLQERNRRFVKEIAFITKNMPYHSALDVGCGTGFEAINYTLMGCKRVVGLDISEKSLEVARSRGEYGVEWRIGDAENLPFEDKSFEFVSAIGALHHTPDTEKAVTEMERVGTKEIVLMLYNRWHYLGWRAKHGWRRPNYDNGCPIVKFYSGRQVKHLFRKFRVTELHALGYDAPFELLKWAWYARATQ